MFFQCVHLLFVGNKKRKLNPTKYRDPAMYMAMFTMLTIPTENEDEVFGFELVLSRPLNSYIKVSYLASLTRRVLQNRFYSR